MAKKVKRKTTTNAEKAKKKAKFKQTRIASTNTQNKMYQAYNAQIRERENLIRRATIVEGILSARPEIAVEKDGILTLNEETTYLNPSDNIIYWKADNNPIVSGLASDLSEYPSYSPEFFNKVFEFISTHRPKPTETVTDIDLGDFDLVEDETFTESIEVVEEDKSEPMTEEDIRYYSEQDECCGGSCHTDECTTSEDIDISVEESIKEVVKEKKSKKSTKKIVDSE